MATRGRESNRLYVDTAYDPDVDTAHEPILEKDSTEALRQVLATSGVDSSATETLADEWAHAYNPVRIEASDSSSAGTPASTATVAFWRPPA